MNSNIAIGTISGRVILCVGAGDDCVILEMTVPQAIDVVERLDKAIYAVAMDHATAKTWDKFMAGFTI